MAPGLPAVLRAAPAQARAWMRRVQLRLVPPPPPERPPCAGLWFTPMVQVNGDVTTCCLDEGLENRLGNLREVPLAELWAGPTVHRWRLAQVEGRFADSGPLCTRCNWRSAGVVARADVEKYLAATGERALLRRYRRSLKHDARNPNPESR